MHAVHEQGAPRSNSSQCFNQPLQTRSSIACTTRNITSMALFLQQNHTNRNGYDSPSQFGNCATLENVPILKSSLGMRQPHTQQCGGIEPCIVLRGKSWACRIANSHSSLFNSVFSPLAPWHSDPIFGAPSTTVHPGRFYRY